MTHSSLIILVIVLISVGVSLQNGPPGAKRFALITLTLWLTFVTCSASKACHTNAAGGRWSAEEPWRGGTPAKRLSPAAAQPGTPGEAPAPARGAGARP